MEPTGPHPVIRFAGGDADPEACHAVYFAAVRIGAAGHYSEAQRRAWAPSEAPEPWMAHRLREGITWLAQQDDRLTGFLTATPAGHLDLFFVRSEARRSPVAPLLHDALIDWALRTGLPRLTTDASHLARRFLERRGWRALAEEQVLRNGVTLSRWRMELHPVAAG